MSMFDINLIRNDFPILARKIHNKPLVYLDNAATSQKPKQVIQALVNYYEQHNANVHRGIHVLGDEATKLYAEARQTVSKFIGANHPSELVFVRNTTEAINLVAYAWGQDNVHKGDLVLTTRMEHHSNIVPWQELVRRVGARLEFVEVTHEGLLDLDDLDKKLRLKPRLVTFTHVSNFLGTINPVSQIVSLIKKRSRDTYIMVDGAQAVPHFSVQVGELGVDFYAFSGHKMYGPMGIGGLWVRKQIIQNMKPFLTGGGMISEVHQMDTIYAEVPDRFDAGTPNVAGAIGLAAAAEYLQTIGMENIARHERELIEYALLHLEKLDYIRIHGPLELEKRGGLVSFSFNGVHAHDVAQILDSEGIAVRSGHHCTMPMHERMNLVGTTRASFALYNRKEDVDRLIEGLGEVKKVFRV